MPKKNRPWHNSVSSSSNIFNSSNSNLGRALAWARIGCLVFPCKEDKSPVSSLVPHGFKDASADTVQIRAWWREQPGALVGIACGLSGLAVLDIDLKNDVDGFATLERLGIDPDATWAAKTRSGGEHRFYIQSGGIGSKTSILKDLAGGPSGLDIRGDGGYVIAWADPPANRKAFASWPTILDEALDRDKALRETPLPTPAPRVGGEPRGAYVDTAIQGELERVRTAEKGSRNATLNGAAFAIGTMVGAGWVSEGEMRGVLEAAALDCGLTRVEARKTIASGLKGGMARPRDPIPELEPQVEAFDPHIADGLLGMRAAPVAAAASSPTWLEPEGLLGEIAGWVEGGAHRPNRSLAVGAAIMTLAAVMSRHMRGPTGLQSHLYAVALGPTGCGKGAPLGAPAQLLRAIGASSCATSGDFKSAPAIEAVLSDNPATLATCDEIGLNLFKRVLSRRASSHETAISSVLRTLWGAGEVYHTSNAKGARSQVINAPALSIWGASTPEEFFASISAGALDDGTVNRFLFIKALPTRFRDRGDRLASSEPPQEILGALFAILPPGSGNLSGGIYALTSHTQPEVMVTPWDNGVIGSFDAFERSNQALIEKDAQAGRYRARTPEIALKLAHIHAVSRAGRGAVIEPGDWAWGLAIAEDSAGFLAGEVDERMADSETQANNKLVLRTIRDLGTTTKSHLGQRLKHKFKAKELDEIVFTLAQNGVVSIEKTVRPGGSPPTFTIRIV